MRHNWSLWITVYLSTGTVSDMSDPTNSYLVLDTCDSTVFSWWMTTYQRSLRWNYVSDNFWPHNRSKWNVTFLTKPPFFDQDQENMIRFTLVYSTITFIFPFPVWELCEFPSFTLVTDRPTVPRFRRGSGSTILLTVTLCSPLLRASVKPSSYLLIYFKIKIKQNSVSFHFLH